MYADCKGANENPNPRTERAVPVTTTTRHLALACTALALVAALLAVDHATSHRPTKAHAEAIPVRRGVTARDGFDRIPSLTSRARIEKTARDFLRAYLPYTHGQRSRLAALRGGVANAALTARLLGSAPHTRPRDSHPDVVQGVRVERLTDRDSVALARMTGPDGGYAVALTVHQDTTGRWQVVDTRPAG